MAITAQKIETLISRAFYAVFALLNIVTALLIVLAALTFDDQLRLDSSSLIYIAMVMTGTTVLLALIRYWLLNKVFDELSFVTRLEQWAESNYRNNVINPIDVVNPVGVTIAKLQQQLLVENEDKTTFYQIFREKALLDKDTGIGNREFFNARLEALLKEEDSYGIICFIQFKEGEVVQTMYGRGQALTLLSSIISIIKYRLQSFPKYYIARRQPYEIALILPELTVEQGEKLAERLLKNFMTISLPVGINHEEFIHLGLSCYQSLDMPYQVMSEADMALRSAQLQGPAQWFMYEPGEIIQAQGSLKWRTFLTKVITRNAFVIFFQPVISARNSATIHYEVLAKLRDNQGKLISARIFMPMVHKCGLTEQVDLLIVKQVCKLIRYESQQQSCSLNLSVESLLNVEFQEKLYAVIIENPDIAEKLIIEVSEYRLMSCLSSLKPILVKLTQFGVKLLVDKVGQYVVSTQYLKSCPVSFIKLHSSLIGNIHEKPENQIIVQSLKVITEPLGIAIFALGVESEQEWQTLLRLGVDGGQGHFFTHPLEQAEFANLVR
ncbi:EAL domain-containing protein [Thalassotalea ganghwensis]